MAEDGGSLGIASRLAVRSAEEGLRAELRETFGGPHRRYGAGTRPAERFGAMSARVTLTFLFTDIAGSTRLWEEAPEAARS